MSLPLLGSFSTACQASSSRGSDSVACASTLEDALSEAPTSLDDETISSLAETFSDSEGEEGNDDAVPSGFYYYYLKSPASAYFCAK